jgi:NADPH:quinone reductase-like Zn-dependent oxidoreductase
MRGAPFLARFDNGLQKPKDTRIGADIAGRVEAIGKDVTEFKPGDEVFGSIYTGGFAEYACGRVDRLALKPANISYEEAAAVPVAALTALQGLRDAGQIKAGQKVLVNGAAGGVGTYAVQIAKAYGAEVTGVCSTRNVEMVRKIGADHVIDYTREDFTRSGQHYDLIFDAMGNYWIADYARALTPTGTCAVAGFTILPRLFQVMLLGPMVSKLGKQKIGLMATATVNKKDLLCLKEMLETGKIKSVIDRCYPLAETAKAIAYLEEGHARGKVIISPA